MDLRSLQKSALRKILLFNEDDTEEPSSICEWKVLVYDRKSRDIISLLLNVKEMRELGVTLHFLLQSHRDSISDVPAIYLVEPSPDNLKRIALDANSGLYHSMFLNFSYSIPSERMKLFCEQFESEASVAKIAKVYDQALNYVTLESNLFSLNESNTLSRLMGPHSDEEVSDCLDKITEGLFCVFATLGIVPYIKCAPGGAAEEIAKRIEKLFQERTLAHHRGQFERPVLIMMDRTLDLPAALHHAWAYSSLLHDLFNMHNNRVAVDVAEKVGEKTTTSTYDLDDTDSFWRTNACSPFFPTVADSMEAAVAEYKARMDQLHLSPDDLGEIGEHTQRLASAMDSLPEMTERKKQIDRHTNLTSAILEQIKARDLVEFYALEENILSTDSASVGKYRTQVQELVARGAGNAEDQLRLVLLFLLRAGDDAYQELKQLLESRGIDTNSLGFLRRNMLLGSGLTSSKGTSSSGASFSSSSSSSASSFFKHMASGLQDGLKSIISANKTLGIVRIVESIMNGKSFPLADAFKTIDPKLMGRPGKLKASTGFTQAVVFMVGGGTYAEYVDLQAFAAKDTRIPKSIVYGATDLVSPTHFVRQLQELGRT
eukprot:GCRY01005160.1.p1 GENE.GCRY01005160.1~~GCRY01005160.1.p1  ORF type:complete len:601 (-),score=147.60 GCRY01005160.1:138-1940(-)